MTSECPFAWWHDDDFSKSKLTVHHTSPDGCACEELYWQVKTSHVFKTYLPLSLFYNYRAIISALSFLCTAHQKEGAMLDLHTGLLVLLVRSYCTCKIYLPTYYVGVIIITLGQYLLVPGFILYFESCWGLVAGFVEGSVSCRSLMPSVDQLKISVKDLQICPTCVPWQESFIQLRSLPRSRREHHHASYLEETQKKFKFTSHCLVQSEGTDGQIHQYLESTVIGAKHYPDSWEEVDLLKEGSRYRYD